MKTIQCDRCGKIIPYVPPYINIARDGYVPPRISVSIWNNITQTIKQVDLCESCMKAVYNYIFIEKDDTIV